MAVIKTQTKCIQQYNRRKNKKKLPDVWAKNKKNQFTVTQSDYK